VSGARFLDRAVARVSLSLATLQRPLLTRRRRAFTLLEILVVLVLLGVSAAMVVPSLRLPGPMAAGAPAPLERARALAIRRGETLRLTADVRGSWQVTAEGDSVGLVLLSGDAGAPAGAPIVLTALGVCLQSGSAPEGNAPDWDPARCAPVRR
jgi:prepilin-type N-terminal cleavage/methylation domain-containing protein